MIVPVGSLINGVAVIGGAGIGIILGNRLSEQMRSTVFQALGLAVLVLGIQMVMATTNPLYIVGSILLGAIAGELLHIEDRILQGAEVLKRSMRSSNTTFSEGFVTVTLLTCIGSFAIMGPLQEGIEGNLTLILTKSILDFFAAMAFGARYGSGVYFAAIPLILYEGSITLLAEQLRPYITPLIRAELEATGGILIIAIGFTLLEIKQIKVSNMLPALVIVVLICLLTTALQ